MSESPDFTLRVDHNKYLPEGQRSIDAVISISTAGERRGPAPTAAQVIMIDCSSSMSGDKMVQARRATATAIKMLNDGVAFAVVAGTNSARMAYPAGRTMVIASPQTRNEAAKAVGRLDPNGGTAIGTWLELANELLAGQPAEIKHGILLTDGHNEHQTEEELAAALRRCRDRFVCHSLGVGKHWAAEPLRAVADALHGDASGLPDERALPDVFRAMAEDFMSTAVGNVALRVWTPRGSRVRFLKQVYPNTLDLTDRRTEVSALVGDYAAGSWGAETRDFHLSVELPAGNVLDDEVLAARVHVVAGGREIGRGLVEAMWTDDPAQSTKIAPMVAHYTGQVELDQVMQEGIGALRDGRTDEATVKLGRAAQIADESNREPVLDAIKGVAEIIDAKTAQIRLRGRMEDVDAEMALLESRKTERWRREDEGS